MMRIAGLEPISNGEWDTEKARHLLNRAGFGLPPELAGALGRMTPEAAVGTLVDYEGASAAQPPPPDFLVPNQRHAELRAATRTLEPEARRQAITRLQQEERRAVAQLKAWWLERMYTTPRPLEEKLTLFWHGHFATSAQKVRQSEWNYALNQVFRTNAAGNFKRLTIEVAQSPAMLRYLDNAQSTRQHPNENWARELLELFTLGPGHYTEQDVKEAARAFTGWSIGPDGFIFRRARHDAGAKTFLGRTGNWTGSDILDIIFDQPAASVFIAGKLWTYFACDHPEPEVVNGLALTLRRHGFELRPMLRQMFVSRAFYGLKAVGTQVKSPAQFVLQLAAGLRLRQPPYARMAQATAQLGQDLFYPPNVKGWDGNRAWINANTLLLRYNLPGQLAAGQGRPGRTNQMAPGMAGGPLQAAREQVNEALQKLPPAERQAWRRRLRDATTPAERRELLRELGIDAQTAGMAISRLIEGLEFDTADALIRQLAGRYLAVPLEPAQRAVLLDALGVDTPDSPLTPESVPLEALESVFRLLFSCAEYQLC